MTRTSIGGMGTLKKQERETEERPPFYRSNDFWRSFVSVFSYWDTFDPLHYRRDPWKADHDALRGDWEAIGLDFTKAIRRFEIEHADELEEARQQQRLFDPDKGT